MRCFAFPLELLGGRGASLFMVKAMHVLSPLWFLTASQQSYYYTTTETTLASQKSADAALTAYIVSINGYG